MTRLQANLEIVKILEDRIHNNVDERFGQMLFNLNINQFQERDTYDEPVELRDIYNDESEAILKRMKNG